MKKIAYKNFVWTVNCPVHTWSWGESKLTDVTDSRMTVGWGWSYLWWIFSRRVCCTHHLHPCTPRMFCQRVSLSDHVLQHADTLNQVPGTSENTTHPVWGCTTWSCLWEGESNIEGASGRADVPTESTAWEELFLVSTLETPYLNSDISISQLPSNTHTFSNPFSPLSEISACFLARILHLYIFCTVFYFGLALP